MKVQMKTASDLVWTYVADNVMGGVSQGQSSFGSDDGQDFVRLTGQVSTENRGGFIQVRTMIDTFETDPAGLVLKVRGNGERYFIHLRTRSTRLPWQYYQAGFEPSGSLLPKRVSPETIRSIGLVAYGRDHAADVSLAEIGVY